MKRVTSLQSFNLFSLVLIVFFLLHFACSSTEPIIDDGSILLKIDRLSFSDEVFHITIRLSNESMAEIVRTIAVSDSIISENFHSIQIGNWRVEANALNDVGKIIYTRTEDIVVEAGETVILTLWLRKLIAYDFDEELPLWGGDATIDIVNGTLELTSTSGIQIRWEIFDHKTPGDYTRGILSLDIYPGKESYTVALNGHSKKNSSILDWGPYVVFRNGKIHYLQPNQTLIATETSYSPGEWYTLRIDFESQRGSRGTYKLYFRHRESTENEILVGEFDYLESIRKSMIFSFIRACYYILFISQ